MARVNLQNANLTDALFSSATNLRNADLTSAVLIGIDLTGVNVGNAIFVGCHLRLHNDSDPSIRSPQE